MRIPYATLTPDELLREAKLLACTTQSILDSTPMLHDGQRRVAQRHIDAIESATRTRPLPSDAGGSDV